MGACEYAADIMELKQLQRGIDTVPLTREPYVHDRQNGAMILCHRNSLISRGGNSYQIEAGVSECVFGLHRDQVVVFNNQYRRSFGRLRRTSSRDFERRIGEDGSKIE